MRQCALILIVAVQMPKYRQVLATLPLSTACSRIRRFRLISLSSACIAEPSVIFKLHEVSNRVVHSYKDKTPLPARVWNRIPDDVRLHMPARRLVMGFLISPLVTPVIIAAAGDVLLLHAAWPWTVAPGVDPGARGAWHALRGDHRDRNPGRLQPRPDPRCGFTGSRAGAHLPNRAVAADRTRCHFGGFVRVRDLVRRSGRRACSWPASSSERFPDRCGPAFARTSARRSWR